MTRSPPEDPTPSLSLGTSSGLSEVLPSADHRRKDLPLSAPGAVNPEHGTEVCVFPFLNYLPSPVKNSDFS